MRNIILAFNLRHSVLRNFGLSLYEHAQRDYQMHLLAVPTLPDEGIEQRALKLSKLLPALLDKLGLNKAHIACYSTCGVDFRFAVSELGLSRYVNTLTTISTPHQYALLNAAAPNSPCSPIAKSSLRRLLSLSANSRGWV
jgi:triacylglycerol esterase/lipase EstA (alpha/beta hydrolase family)